MPSFAIPFPSDDLAKSGKMHDGVDHTPKQARLLGGADGDEVAVVSGVIKPWKANAPAAQNLRLVAGGHRLIENHNGRCQVIPYRIISRIANAEQAYRRRYATLTSTRFPLAWSRGLWTTSGPVRGRTWRHLEPDRVAPHPVLVLARATCLP